MRSKVGSWRGKFKTRGPGDTGTRREQGMVVESHEKETFHDAKHQKLQRTTRLSSGDRCCDANLRNHKMLSVGRAVFDGRSDAASITFRVFEHRRSLAQTALSGPLRKQAQ